MVRKLCDQCKASVKVSIDTFPENFKIPEILKNYYKAIGCESCFYTGYSGRKAIYEIIPITRELAEHIKKNELEIDKYLIEKKIATLKDNALQLIINGDTSIEEVYPLLTNY